MSKRFFLLLLALPGALWAQTNAAAYNVTIHVTASRVAVGFSDGPLGVTSLRIEQRLTAKVGGSTYELTSDTALPKGVVALGDYKAKLVKDESKPTNEFTKVYELMFPDGSTRKFEVTGQME